jgi:hypothetical protein
MDPGLFRHLRSRAIDRAEALTQSAPFIAQASRRPDAGHAADGNSRAHVGKGSVPGCLRRDAMATDSQHTGKAR